MKRMLSVLLIIAAMVPALSACGSERVEESREIVDGSYTPPYSEVKTDYEHVYDFGEGDFVLVPQCF